MSWYFKCTMFEAPKLINAKPSNIRKMILGEIFVKILNFFLEYSSSSENLKFPDFSCL